MAKIIKTKGENAPEKDEHNDDFDGIKELNNPAPNWIILVFIATIGFSLFYGIRYFGYPGNEKDQASEYKISSAEFDKAHGQQPDASKGGSVMGQEEMLTAGAAIFAQKGCIACHGLKGEGNVIGPNLTDNFWLNGCSQENVIHMITEGKPEKGMTPFKTMLTQEEIKSVSLFVLKKLVGSNPPNGKAPQGVECKP
ncbi:MAG: cbb3-type cytochrome c oxidase N-terminal domain-containing protein [Mariniphaga sp.]